MIKSIIKAKMTKINLLKIKLIMGIGNSDSKYENTYHNIGFMAIDYLIKKVAIENKWSKTNFFEYHKNGNLVFAKSLTYMNKSGSAVKSALTYFKLTPEEILIIHDDSDIALGQYKLVFNRGPAGHNGIKSIIGVLKTEKFWRFRVGARKNLIRGQLKASEFILKKVETQNKRILRDVFDELLSYFEIKIK